MRNGGNQKPLAGVRVLEVGQAIAGPFAGTLLGYFGAEIVKVEPPGTGDPIRTWRMRDPEGTSIWWRSIARNKKCITLDLRSAEGQRLARELVRRCDVLIENFRPGTMEEWGLGPDTLRAEQPGLVYVRVSGFGQTGPYAHRPGYASVAEAMAGLRHLTGHPGEVPVRANLSIGDSLAGIHAAFGVLLALLARERGTASGQVVDVALTESLFNVLEAVLPEYDRFGHVREPSGTTITGIAPSNAYRARDGRFVVVAANGDSLFVRLMRAIGRDDLAAEPALATNPGRVANVTRLDAAISAWVQERDAAEVVATLEAAEVPAGMIYDAADIARDPHFRARGVLEPVDVDGRPVALGALAPRLEATPGGTDFAGPALGAHNDEIFGEWLGLSQSELDALRTRKVI